MAWYGENLLFVIGIHHSCPSGHDWRMLKLRLTRCVEVLGESQIAPCRAREEFSYRFSKTAMKISIWGNVFLSGIANMIKLSHILYLSPFFLRQVMLCLGLVRVPPSFLFSPCQPVCISCRSHLHLYAAIATLGEVKCIESVYVWMRICSGLLPILLRAMGGAGWGARCTRLKCTQCSAG